MTWASDGVVCSLLVAAVAAAAEPTEATWQRMLSDWACSIENLE